jgi:hypothetical protein
MDLTKGKNYPVCSRIKLGLTPFTLTDVSDVVVRSIDGVG